MALAAYAEQQPVFEKFAESSDVADVKAAERRLAILSQSPSLPLHSRVPADA
jgi:hypothetical protein